MLRAGQFIFHGLTAHGATRQAVRCKTLLGGFADGTLIVVATMLDIKYMVTTDERNYHSVYRLATITTLHGCLLPGRVRPTACVTRDGATCLTRAGNRYPAHRLITLFQRENPHRRVHAVLGALLTNRHHGSDPHNHHADTGARPNHRRLSAHNRKPTYHKQDTLFSYST